MENQRVLWNREVRLALAAQEQERLAQKPGNADSYPTTGSQLQWLTQGDLQQSDETAVMAANLAKEDIEAAAAMVAMEAIDPSVSAPPTSTFQESVNPSQVSSGRFLTKERKEKLDQIGFVWCKLYLMGLSKLFEDIQSLTLVFTHGQSALRRKQIDDHWDSMFAQLCKFKATHGDCIVPSRYEENLKLGKWVSHILNNECC